MLTLTDVSFEFGGRFLYREASLDIQQGDRIGLIGRNGTGKSTLLRLMAGEYQPTEGSIIKARDLQIGYLNQDLLEFASDQTVFEVARSAFEPVLKLQAEIEALLVRLEKDHSDDNLLHDLSEKQEQFGAKGGYEMEAQTSTILAGLGFAEEDQHRAFNTFSGGWRMRAILARILLQLPDLLLLDEPTNHLDLPSIEWLEDYLSRSPAAIILVTHDRTFLQRNAKRIVEVAHGRLNHYAGSYDYYLEEKALRSEIQQAAYENQQKFIEDKQQLINRFRAKASKAAMAQSWIKALERLDRVEAPESDDATASFAFLPAPKSGADVLTVSHARKAFGPKTILTGTSATVRRGDKIGLIGPNGVGKSTVLRVIAGTEPFEGERALGYNVQPTFFAQHQLDALNVDRTILEECIGFADHRGETYIRSVLGSFLFTGDDVFKKIKVLSGGERSRVALAKTLLAQANFLLLDEPTNHLDMQSIQILAQALQAYDGSYVVVSHDRTFLENTANKVWYLEGGQICEYPGTFSEYELWKAARIAEARAATPKSSQNKTASAAPKPAAVAPPPANGALRETLKKDLKTKVSALKKAEATVSELEQKIASLDEQLLVHASGTDYHFLATLERDKQRLQDDLGSHMRLWEVLAQEVDTLEHATR
jgi:ATP-binding cassette subfamily F protein 3